MSMKLVTLNNLSKFAEGLNAKFAKNADLTALSSKVDGLITAGGEPNKLEGIKVNGTALAIADKIVDILIATGTANGTIKVNGVDVSVAGLKALAYKANVSESDLDAALKAVINAKASGADLTALTTRVTAAEGAITTLNGAETVEGSVKKQVADAVAGIIADAPEAYDTLKEISDWISSHSDSAAAMNSQINTNKGDIATLKTQMADRYTKTEINTTLAGYVKSADIEVITDAEIQALLSDNE